LLAGQTRYCQCTCRQRCPSMMLLSTILLTKAFSPPGVIISSSVPVQIYRNIIFTVWEYSSTVGISEQSALGRSSFVAAVRVASSVLALNGGLHIVGVDSGPPIVKYGNVMGDRERSERSIARLILEGSTTATTRRQIIPGRNVTVATSRRRTFSGMGLNREYA